VISGTDFEIEEAVFVTHACRGLRPGVASASEIDEIRAQCEANRALCLACDDGMVVIDLRPGSEGLELFVWIAVAFRFGAFERQVAALDSIGRELGAQTIAFQTRRRGWARRLGPEWHRRGTLEFVRLVQ
jgi:hypothetical protein